MRDVAIVGAGASGLLCGILCAKKGLSVTIFEKNTKIGRKILASGNGRCNISNTSISIDDYFSQNLIFVKEILDKFSFADFEKLMLSFGMLLEKKADGRVYPLSNEARSVVKIFEDIAKSFSVEFILNHKIEDVDDLFSKYKNVVIATGSNAAVKLGGTEDGYNFAKFYGHNIVPLYPSLVQLELASGMYEKLSGIKIDAEVTLFINGQKELVQSGDILFTNYGISGFVILDISQRVASAFLEYAYVDISCNLLPQFSTQKLSAFLLARAKELPKIEFLTILAGVVTLKVAKVILEILGIPFTTLCQDVNTKTTKRVASKITSLKFEVKDTHGFNYAEVSGGGVDTLELNVKTLESLKRKNLYFCGEVLDVVGKRGGYNFAWAFSSAYSVAKGLTL